MAGLWRASAARALGGGEMAGIADHAGDPLLAARPGVKRHHGALAEPDQRQLLVREPVAGELGVEEGVEHRRGAAHAGGDALEVAQGKREPLPADRRLGAGFRRVRGYEGGVRKDRLERAADIDEVVAVGAIAMQEDHQALGRAAGGGAEARAVEHDHTGTAAFCLVAR